MIYVDRSRREAAEKCMRKRWWQYEYRGRGIEPTKRGMSEFPLWTGSAVHRGVEEVHISDVAHLSTHVELARHTWRNEAEQWMAEDARQDELANEQQALVEGLVAAWWYTKRQWFDETYEVLSVEREEQAPLTRKMLWMARPDMLVRRRTDGALFIVNLKTTKKVDDRWMEQWNYDQQTLSECVAVEERLGEKLSGVIIGALLKGEKLEYPKRSGLWYHNSPLIWAWHNESGKPHPRGEWSARYEWRDEDGGHKLGNTWKKRAIWSTYPGGVLAWVEHLMVVDPAIVEEQVVLLPPVLRSDFEVQRWRDQTVSTETLISMHRAELSDVSSSNMEDMNLALDVAFPMSTSHGNCIWPSRCPYMPLCWENADPDDDSLYQIRVPNHPQEAESNG